MLKPETKAEMDKAADAAEAAITLALFELLMAQRREPMDVFIHRVASRVANA